MHHRIAALTLGVALGVLASGPVVAQDIGQSVVTDGPSGASVALHASAAPQSQTDPRSGIEVRFYLANTGDLASTLSVFEISEATGGYDIDGGVQGSAAGSGGTLETCTPALQQGFPARDFSVAVSDENGNTGVLKSRLVYTGEHVVQVQALGSDARAADVDTVFHQLISTLDVPLAAGPSPAAAASTSPASAPPSCSLALPSGAPASVAPAG